MGFLQSSVRNECFNINVSIFENIGGGVPEFLANRVCKRICYSIPSCKWSSIYSCALILIGVEILLEILCTCCTKACGVVVVSH